MFNLSCPSPKSNGLRRELIDGEKKRIDTVLCEMYLGFIYVRTRFFGPKLNYYMIKDEKNHLLAKLVLFGDFGRNPCLCILFEFEVWVLFSTVIAVVVCLRLSRADVLQKCQTKGEVKMKMTILSITHKSTDSDILDEPVRKYDRNSADSIKATISSRLTPDRPWKCARSAEICVGWKSLYINIDRPDPGHEGPLTFSLGIVSLIMGITFIAYTTCLAILMFSLVKDLPINFS